MRCQKKMCFRKARIKITISTKTEYKQTFELCIKHMHEFKKIAKNLTIQQDLID